MQIAGFFKHKVICHEYDISIYFNKNNFEIGTLFGELPSLSFITVSHLCRTTVTERKENTGQCFLELGLAEDCLSGKEMVVLVLYFVLAFLCCCVLEKNNKSEH